MDLHAGQMDDENSKLMPVVLHSIITCPECGQSKRELMPTNACQFYYECTGCGVMLKPTKGDCCVFCSYGDTKCPPIQEGSGCCRWIQPGGRLAQGGMTLVSSGSRKT